ncbi:unnamed protein product [Rotaria socialis]|uniref:Uncharacterized protein n=1 Tax=Rotaria socialis TaxID=392032 RepID=A0A817PQB2_9BILA|nr:unnamed protein product [Rotaria socialis]CAF3331700.1 unnamed protein product [Rotaria socialis]CAF3500370.1 unnamed protein product [Rotaria socialis]CAF3541756.1 unnamed protein product [Rotaria socialis]CAF3586709.1 unnamed protein product [Rotaria socialis]
MYHQKKNGPCLVYHRLVHKKSGLYKLRRKALSPSPRGQKFIVPSIYQETYCKERFLIYDKRKIAYEGRSKMYASEE